MPALVRVAIIDDHGLIASGLASLLREEDPSLSVDYVGGTATAFLASGVEVDVVVLDVDLGADQPAAADTVAALEQRGIPVLLVSALTSGHMVRSALLAGASGYLPKKTSTDEFVAAIRTIAGGQVLITREIAAVLAEYTPNLSERESEAVGLYAQGLPLKTVARRMNVKEVTAREYLQRARAKFEIGGTLIRTRVDWAEAASAMGINRDRRP